MYGEFILIEIQLLFEFFTWKISGGKLMHKLNFQKIDKQKMFNLIYCLKWFIQNYKIHPYDKSNKKAETAPIISVLGIISI